MPASLLDAPFTDQEGRSVTLRQFAGKAVFVVPFLTSCQEECPITTGALLALERRLTAQHLTSKTAIVEVTVDPARDIPRANGGLRQAHRSDVAFAHRITRHLAALWHYLGIYYQLVPEGSPPGIDWETGKPYTYDVDHSDGFILLDPTLHERFVAAGMVSGASVPKSLRRFLDAQGVYDSKHPGGGSWTVEQGLAAIDWVLK